MAEVLEIPPGAAPGARMHLSWAVEDTLVFPPNQPCGRRHERPATVSAASAQARWPRLRRPDPVALMALPAFAYLAASYGWPLIALLGHSLSGPDGISLAPFRAVPVRSV